MVGPFQKQNSNVTEDAQSNDVRIILKSLLIIA
jgi:hypothetical protein